MNSRTKALPNLIGHGPAPRRATRLARAATLIVFATVAAVSCGDSSRLTGPLRVPYQVRPAKIVLDSAPAPAELKGVRTVPGTGASPSAAGLAPRLLSASASAAVGAAAADPGLLVADPIPFKYESGPFKYPVAVCEDCVLGEQDASGNATGRGFPIGFDFTFYGNTYSEFFLSTNGFIMFGPDLYDGCCGGGPLPSVEHPNNIIAVAWADLFFNDPSQFGQISYETRGTAPRRRLVVDFNQVPLWNDPAETVSAQIVLYEGTNIVELHTKSAHVHSDIVTQGVENLAGTAGAFLAGRVQNFFDLDTTGVRFSGGGEIPNYEPTVNPGGNVGNRYEGVEGKAISFAAIGSDADNDSLSYAWDFNADGVVDAEHAQAQYTYGDDGNYTARVTVADGKGGVVSSTVEVLVANAAPTGELKGPESVDEGSSMLLTAANVSDAPADLQAGFEFAFDCGMGGGFGAFSREASASCVTEDDTTLTVGLKIRDKNGWEASYTKAVTVLNVAPVVHAGQPLTARSGELVSLLGHFTDAGKKDRVWKWKWAAAASGTSPEQGVVNPLGESEEQGAVPGSFKACVPGTHQITLEVTDKDGAPSQAIGAVVVAPAAAAMEVKGDVEVSGGGNPEVTIFLFSSPTFDATSIDPASIRLTNGSGRGTPLATLKSKGKKATADGGWDLSIANLNEDSLRDVKLGFSRSALIANGDLTETTTSWTLTGRAGSCLNIAATSPVVVK